MSKVTDSIYSGSVIVPLADVQHIEPWPKNSVPGIFVVTKHTRWDFDRDHWANAIWIGAPEAVTFKADWCRYRSELEAETLADLTPPHHFIDALTAAGLDFSGFSWSGFNVFGDRASIDEVKRLLAAVSKIDNRSQTCDQPTLTSAEQTP